MNGATPVGPRVVMTSRVRPSRAAWTTARRSEKNRWTRSWTPAGTNWTSITPTMVSTSSGVISGDAVPHPVTRRPRIAAAFENDEALKKTHPRHTNWNVQNRWKVDRTVPSAMRSEEHTSELQSLRHLVCRLLLE